MVARVSGLAPKKYRRPELPWHTATAIDALRPTSTAPAVSGSVDWATSGHAVVGAGPPATGTTAETEGRAPSRTPVPPTKVAGSPPAWGARGSPAVARTAAAAPTSTTVPTTAAVTTRRRR